MEQKGTNDFAAKMLEAQKQLEAQEAVEQTTEANAEVEAKETEEKAKKTILDVIIEESDGELTAAQVDEWKAMYGEKVYAVRFDKKDSFIFRYIANPEWKQLMKQFQGNKFATEELLDEMLFNKCVLYPTVTDHLKATVGGGTIQTLALQIRVASNFLPDSVAIDMIQKI